MLFISCYSLALESLILLKKAIMEAAVSVAVQPRKFNFNDTNKS